MAGNLFATKCLTCGQRHLVETHSAARSRPHGNDTKDSGVMERVSLRNLDTPESREFWERIARATAEWAAKKPDWLRRIERAERRHVGEVLSMSDPARPRAEALLKQSVAADPAQWPHVAEWVEVVRALLAENEGLSSGAAYKREKQLRIQAEQQVAALRAENEQLKASAREVAELNQPNLEQIMALSIAVQAAEQREAALREKLKALRHTYEHYGVGGYADIIKGTALGTILAMEVALASPVTPRAGRSRTVSICMTCASRGYLPPDDKGICHYCPDCPEGKRADAREASPPAADEAWREDAEALVQRIVAECADREGELYDLHKGVDYVLSLVRCVLSAAPAPPAGETCGAIKDGKRCDLPRFHDASMNATPHEYKAPAGETARAAVYGLATGLAVSLVGFALVAEIQRKVNNVLDVLEQKRDV